MNNNREAFVRIVRRDELPFYKRYLVRGVAIFVALLVCALFIFFITKLAPIDVYVSMYKGAFGTVRKVWITVRDAFFLLLIAVALAPAFKMSFWNCGAEGQVLMGGLVTAALMIYFGESISTPLLLMIMLVTSALAGALWGILPAIFKSKFSTNETLFTLMLNYVAIQIVEFFVDFWDKKQSHSVGVINMHSEGGWFPRIMGQSYILNIVIVLIITLVVYFYLKYSKHGYEIAVVGQSEATARYAGINVGHVIRRTVALSGALCGVAGFVEVAGISHTISSQTAGGRGFTAIIVCWLAKFNTVSMILISLLLIFLDKGAGQIASDFQLNEYACNIISGIILFFIIGSEFFLNYKLVFRHREERQ